jgi:hypothetical protein
MVSLLLFESHNLPNISVFPYTADLANIRKTFVIKSLDYEHLIILGRCSDHLFLAILHLNFKNSSITSCDYLRMPLNLDFKEIKILGNIDEGFAMMFHDFYSVSMSYQFFEVTPTFHIKLNGVLIC